MTRVWTSSGCRRKYISFICVTCLALATYGLTCFHLDSKKRTTYSEHRSSDTNEIGSETMNKDYRKQAGRKNSRGTMNINNGQLPDRRRIEHVSLESIKAEKEMNKYEFKGTVNKYGLRMGHMENLISNGNFSRTMKGNDKIQNTTPELVFNKVDKDERIPARMGNRISKMLTETVQKNSKIQDETSEDIFTKTVDLDEHGLAHIGNNGELKRDKPNRLMEDDADDNYDHMDENDNDSKEYVSSTGERVGDIIGNPLWTNSSGVREAGRTLELKKGERIETAGSPMRTVSIGNYWPYGIVSTLRSMGKHIHRILDEHTGLKTERDRLLKLLRPVLNVSQKKMIMEQLYALFAVVWMHCFNETVLNYENITLSETYAYNPTQQGERQTIDCGNIHQINNVSRIARGYFKGVYKGVYMGKELVIKSANYRHFNHRHSGPGACRNDFTAYVGSPLSLLIEVFLRQFLTHPSLSKMYGHRIHDGLTISGTFFSPGVVTVHQLATQPGLYNNTDVETALRYSVEVADLLRYVENSQLGRLYLRDFRTEQFLLVDSHITLVDYHMIDSLDENNCSSKKIYHVYRECTHNFRKADFVFFKYLLQIDRYPVKMRPLVFDIHLAITSYSINASQLYERLRNLHMYYRAHYLN